MPKRFVLPPILNSLIFTIAVVFIIWSMVHAEISIISLWEGLPWMGEALSQMFPPSAKDADQFQRVLNSMLTTLQIAVAGGVIGLIISFAVAWLAAANHTPHFTVAMLTRSVITMFRSIPDVIWAIFFVMTVGLGPFAGALAIMVDTIGYCGRFYAESMEEVDPHPAKACAPWGPVIYRLSPAAPFRRRFQR